MPLLPRFVLLWFTLCALFIAPTLLIGAAAPSAQELSFFESRIRPVLAEKCYECHSATAKKLKAGLLLDTRAGLLEGGDSGPALVPGDPKNSLLMKGISYHDRDFEMPPKERLPASVVADFERWIAMGAPDPRDGKGAAKAAGIDLEEGRKHWSFQPVSNPAVPKVKNQSWPRTDIDRFILAALEEKNLQPVADATETDLKRRIAFDLTGLPPLDPRDGSLITTTPEKLIERLLAAPSFGERWGRRWLDVARYAESTGSGHDVLFPLAFRYRDWVVDSINADKPYDQFIREQLAGDLLPARDDAQRNEQIVATGFLAVGVKDLRERKVQRYRMAMAEEQIDATSRAFLGLTVACARCHDHKFDPIPTRDYYALAGIFTSAEPMLGARRNRERDPFAAGLVPLAGARESFGDADLAAMLKERVDLTYARIKTRNAKWEVYKTLDVPVKKATAVHEAEADKDAAVMAAAAEVTRLTERYQALRARYDAAVPHSAVAMREATPQDCAIHVRGEDTQLGEIVPRGFLSVLTNDSTPRVNPQQSGRLQLAEWIASPRHPLTARVMVNRIWLHLFGEGLVESPDDFGKTGQAPSNPALLDHLAQRFVAHGWSVKKMITEIMSSRVYQLSSAHDASAFEVDPGNRLRWRMSRRRLDSDAIQDGVRLISGALDLQRPAPTIPATEDDDRVKSRDLKAWFEPSARCRTIYQPVLRNDIPEEWSVFDFPDPELVTGRRGTTTVPTQALYFMNSPFIVGHSKKTGERIAARVGAGDRPAFVAEAYALILNRVPSQEEKHAAIAFLESFDPAAEPTAAGAAFCQALFASAEFRYLN